MQRLSPMQLARIATRVALLRAPVATHPRLQLRSISDASGNPFITPRWATTGLEFPGCRIVENKGLVTGVVVRGRNVIVDTIGQFQALLGGNLTIYSDMFGKARQEAMELMLHNAANEGANAVIGVRFDTGTIIHATEVLCYGTAVVIEPNGGAGSHGRSGF